jgi:hypothetical protein
MRLNCEEKTLKARQRECTVGPVRTKIVDSVCVFIYIVVNADFFRIYIGCLSLNGFVMSACVRTRTIVEVPPF